MDKQLQPESTPLPNSLRDYLQGFGLTVGISLALALLGWALLSIVGGNVQAGEAFKLIMLLGLLALLTVGGQFAFGILIENVMAEENTPPSKRKLNAMHALGGISAWLLAYYLGPLALDYVNTPDHEPECETLWERKIGPVTFSKSTCEK